MKHNQLQKAADTFHLCFPQEKISAIEAQAQPGNYKTKITAGNMIQAVLLSFLGRVPSMESMLERFPDLLPTRHKSSLSYAFARESNLTVIGSMLEALSGQQSQDKDGIVVIDSMAVTLPQTQRGKCAKYNNNTKGGVLLWELCINPIAGVNPIKLHKFVQGAINDCYQIRSCSLAPNGPLYVMDRGFYSIKTMRMWHDDNVRFLVRGKRQQCNYKVLETVSVPRTTAAGVTIKSDAIALIGKCESNQVVARVVECICKNGEDLILVTGERDLSAEKLLENYKKRWLIERFHNVIKNIMGLAHLYSFQADGIEFMVKTAFLLAMIIYISRDLKSDRLFVDIVNLIRGILNRIRKILDVSIWKANTIVNKRAKKRSPQTIER